MQTRGVYFGVHAVVDTEALPHFNETVLVVAFAIRGRATCVLDPAQQRLESSNRVRLQSLSAEYAVVIVHNEGICRRALVRELGVCFFERGPAASLAHFGNKGHGIPSVKGVGTDCRRLGRISCRGKGRVGECSMQHGTPSWGRMRCRDKEPGNPVGTQQGRGSSAGSWTGHCLYVKNRLGPGGGGAGRPAPRRGRRGSESGRELQRDAHGWTRSRKGEGRPVQLV